jgi:hypothetical protein
MILKITIKSEKRRGSRRIARKVRKKVCQSSLEKIKINKIMLNKVPIMMSQRFDFMAWCRES